MIYVYYGRDCPRQSDKDSCLKGTVPEYLDGAKVFSFFDDFSGTNLNAEKWQARYGLKKIAELKDGYLALRDCVLLSRQFKMKYGILEFKARAEENASIQAILKGKLELAVYSSAYPGAEHTIAINDMAKLNIGKPIQPLTYYIYKVIVNPQGVIFERYSQDYEKQAEIHFLDIGGQDEASLGLKADAAPFNGGSVYFDWVRVRPYVEVEPVCQSPVSGQPVKE